MTRFAHGLVVGKFSPLHRGHERLVQEAMQRCQRLLLLSWCMPEAEGMPAALRERWLRLRFPALPAVVLDEERLVDLCRARGVEGVRPMPGNEAPNEVHRDFVLWLCQAVLPWPADAVFTSEAYGAGFALHLQRGLGHRVAHVEVDRARRAVPISGTALRQALAAGLDVRAWVAPEVHADIAPRACLLGGESSGKSTLAAALALRLGTRHVAEYGRELWEARGGTLMFSDYLHIAQEQLRRERLAAAGANGWLVCDTSPLTTLFYALEQFGHADARLWALASHRYHRVFLCAPDFPFVQDGTRREPGFRERQHAWYEQALRERGLGCHVLAGSVDERVEQAVRVMRLSDG